MKSILLIFLILILSSASVRSQLNQEWLRSYNGPVNGNDEALAHTVDNAGNIYAAGKFVGAGTGFDIYTVKYSTSGNILWEKIFNGPGNGNDIAYSIAIDNSGNVYVAGESKGESSNNDYVLIKYNNLGEEQWSRRYNGAFNSVDVPVAVVTDNSGNAIITGKSWEEGVLFDIVTIKYTSEGVVQWKKQYNGAANGNEMANDLVVDAAGSVYVTGSSLGAATLNDFVTIKYSSSGEELWVKGYDGPVNGNDNFTFLTLDPSNNLIVSGTSVGSGTSLDFATIKYSPAGVELWMKRFTTPSVNIEEPKSITSDINGNIYITGTTTGFSSSYDYMTVKYSALGEEMWAKNYNGPSSFNFDESSSVTVDNNGNVYVAGFSAGIGTMDDIVIVKYSSSGSENWVSRFNNPAANRDDRVSSITLDFYGNVIVSGFVTNLPSGTDFSVIKFSQLTSIKTSSIQNVSDYQLFQNYPNPFNPGTIINYQLSMFNFISLKVFNALGEEVSTLVNEMRSPGNYKVEFSGNEFPNGVYFYSLFADGVLIDTKRMVLLK